MNGKCKAAGLKEISLCQSILKSQCGEHACWKENGPKLKMVLPVESNDFYKKRQRVLLNHRR